MKYCAKYSNNIDLTNFDEISIIHMKGEEEQLIDFIKRHQAKKITVVVKDYFEFHKDEEWKMFNAIHQEYPDFNFNVCFCEVGLFRSIDDTLKVCMESLEVPYYTGFLAVNFDQLHHLCRYGVKEVYIGEEICFDLMRAQRVASNYGVTFRAFPNVGQSSVKDAPALQKFFIRPEDIEEYSQYIDTVEFWGPLNRQDILRRIYSKGKWFGDLTEIILDMDLPIDSMRIVPGFAHARMNCDRKCMKGGNCKICSLTYDISQQLKEKQLIISQKRAD